MLSEFKFHPLIKIASIIIGARGSNHIRLQEESGCSIQLRGQGVTTANNPVPHEPMHLLVRYDTPDQLVKLRETLEDIIRIAEEFILGIKPNSITPPGPKMTVAPKTPVECFYSVHYICHFGPNISSRTFLSVYESYYGFPLDQRFISLGSGNIARSVLRVPRQVFKVKCTADDSVITDYKQINDSLNYVFIAQWAPYLTFESFVSFLVGPNKNTAAPIDKRLLITRTSDNNSTDKKTHSVNDDSHGLPPVAPPPAVPPAVPSAPYPPVRPAADVNTSSANYDNSSMKVSTLPHVSTGPYQAVKPPIPPMNGLHHHHHATTTIHAAAMPPANHTFDLHQPTYYNNYSHPVPPTVNYTTYPPSDQYLGGELAHQPYYANQRLLRGLNNEKIVIKVSSRLYEPKSIGFLLEAIHYVVLNEYVKYSSVKNDKSVRQDLEWPGVPIDTLLMIFRNEYGIVLSNLKINDMDFLTILNKHATPEYLSLKWSKTQEPILMLSFGTLSLNLDFIKLSL